MWNDVETTIDYLHFSVVSKTVAELIEESGENPISIGVSGNWGVGKSSMVKMIGKELMVKDESKEDSQYVFLEFNAWLYQGFDDAKSALLQAVAKKLEDEVKQRKLFNVEEIGDKFKKFVKRINWFQVSKMALPLLAGFIPGATSVGVIANFVNALKNSAANPDKVTKNSGEINNAFEALTPEVTQLLNEDTSKPITQQIEELRTEFEELLDKMKITLVVLVDDLDRCLPETAISTLEAMRLLLFVKRTAFIIAADEQMIRNGVKAHFGQVELTDGLITSYFDKLIQVPIQVPHLGVAEIKVYIVLLFLELEVRRKHLTKEASEQIHQNLEHLLDQAWTTEITKGKIEGAFDAKSLDIMRGYISIADEIAGILVTADNIKGNPRLIKRLLNALEIRKRIAHLNGMTLDPNVLIKMLLFERCASAGAFDYLLKQAAKSEDGRLEFIQAIEKSLEKDNEYIAPHPTWNSDFVKKWLMLSPKIGDKDIRPLLYLSRDRSLALAAYDELSQESQEILEALKNVKGAILLKELEERIKAVGEKEAETLLVRMASIGRDNQWALDTVCAAIHITEAFPDLGARFALLLAEIPAKSRKAPIIPIIVDKPWAKELLKQWKNDADTPQTVKKAIEQKERKG